MSGYTESYCSLLDLSSEDLMDQESFSDTHRTYRDNSCSQFGDTQQDEYPSCVFTSHQNPQQESSTTHGSNGSVHGTFTSHQHSHQKSSTAHGTVHGTFTSHQHPQQENNTAHGTVHGTFTSNQHPQQESSTTHGTVHGTFTSHQHPQQENSTTHGTVLGFTSDFPDHHLHPHYNPGYAIHDGFYMNRQQADDNITANERTMFEIQDGYSSCDYSGQANAMTCYDGPNGEHSLLSSLAEKLDRAE
ncbi:hypothetical protein PoB_007286000 [Plakobranchus ocellatus]|uniref:Uncharacterized protein n=1 Tax=Plakobranchus ocellatus TaxID=259542 RepID=A0AAV4DQX9_9GAST|nr:hypothetical protein PoB_007286000 [Plakobranchus ocellatus]